MIHWLTKKVRRWQMKTHKAFGTSPSELRVSLGDLDSAVAEALAAAFDQVDSVEVVEGNLLDLEYDAIVSPANSFGDMGGGIDKAIDDRHQGAAQKAVMAAIAEHHFGELPVGSAVVLKCLPLDCPSSWRHRLCESLAMSAAQSTPISPCEQPWSQC
jgi:hypothetical protein